MIIASLIFILTYAIIMSERFNKAAIALLGAFLMIFTGILSQEKAVENIDFNTMLITLMAERVMSVTGGDMVKTAFAITWMSA